MENVNIDVIAEKEPEALVIEDVGILAPLAPEHQTNQSDLEEIDQETNLALAEQSTVIQPSISTTSKNPWLVTYLIKSQAEIEAIKITAKYDLAAKWRSEGYPDADSIANQFINDHILMSYLPVTNHEGKSAKVAGLLTDNSTIKVVDLIEPDKGNNVATLSRGSCYFDATYTTPLRGGERYRIGYHIDVMKRIVDQLIDYQSISHEQFLKALVENIIFSKIPIESLNDIENILLMHEVLKKKHGLKKAVDDAKTIPHESITVDTTKYTDQALELLKDYAVLAANDGKVKIINTTKHGIAETSKSGLKIQFENNLIKGVNPVDLWLKSKKRKEFDGTVFDPSNSEQSTKYNLFKGFKYKPSNKIDITLFKTFVLEVICSDDTEMFNILWSYVAQVLQQPTKKLGTAVVMLAPKGTGKGTFMYAIGKLFEGYFLQTADDKRILGEFNAHLTTTLVAYANELSFVKSKKVVSKLKNIVTETSFTYEAKFGPTYSEPNYTRVFIDSNDDKVVVQTEDERRFIYPHVSEKRIGDERYFNELYKLFETEGFYETLMEDLINFDFSPWEHFLKIPPKNEISEDQMIENFSDLESWWLTCLEGGVIPYARYHVAYDGKLEIANEEMYTSFIKHTKSVGRRVDLNNVLFGKSFKKHIIKNADLRFHAKTKSSVNTRVNSYVYETREKFVEHFQSTKKLTTMNYDGLDWAESTVK